ncbi:MAG: hypothetical protein ACOYXO_08730, partial [Chloroflexota bacterium]
FVPNKSTGAVGEALFSAGDNSGVVSASTVGGGVVRETVHALKGIKTSNQRSLFIFFAPFLRKTTTFLASRCAIVRGIPAEN